MTTARSHEQIMAQFEARLAELEAEANSPHRLRPCADCRWSRDRGIYMKCTQPLVKGFADSPPYAWDCADHSGKSSCALCGPEKALWAEPAVREPILSRLWAWFVEPWTTARIEAFGQDPKGLDGEATKAGSAAKTHREG